MRETYPDPQQLQTGFLVPPDQSWHSIIPHRHSIRNYDESRPPELHKIQQLIDVCAVFKPFTTTHIESISNPPDDIFSHVIGFYGNIKNAPAFFAFIGDMRDPHIHEKTGYTGEAIILEATSLGLGTCWVAGTYNAKSVQSMLPLDVARFSLQ